MFRKGFSFGGMLLFAAAAIVVMPGPGQAQRYSGGGYYGAGGLGSYRSSAYYGGARYGGNYYGSPYTYLAPYRQPTQRYGYSSYYPYYSGYSGDYSYSSETSGADSYPYDNPALQPDLRDSGSYGTLSLDYSRLLNNASVDSNQSFNAPARFIAGNTAQITVRVPLQSEVWFDGSATTSTGPVREYRSPPLTPGGRYVYEIRARWNEDGHEVTQVQRVGVTAGSRIDVSFPLSGTHTGQPSTAKN